MFGQTIAVDWGDPSLDFVTQTVLKKYCSLIHGQPNYVVTPIALFLNMLPPS
jgi:hypothetical protein